MSNTPDKSKHVHILHQSSASKDWENIGKESLSQSPMIRFYCNKFSPILVAIPQKFFDHIFPDLSCVVKGYLSNSATNNFRLTFFLFSEVSERQFRDEIDNSNHTIALSFGPLIVKNQDFLDIEVEVNVPRKFGFHPQLHLNFQVDLFCRQHLSQTSALVCLDAAEYHFPVTIDAALSINGEPQSHQGFNYQWNRPGKKKDSRSLIFINLWFS